MAGVLEQIRRPKKQLVGNSIPKVNEKVLQLQAAKEILAEVFDTDISEVEEMLKQRHEESLEKPQKSRRHSRQHQSLLGQRSIGTEEWPLEFCLAD